MDPGTLSRWIHKAPDLMEATDAELKMEVMATSKLLEYLGRKAVQKIAHIMDHAQSERTALEAARDLADRAKDTSKVHRTESVKLELDKDDVAKLGLALERSAAERSKFARFAEGEHIAKEAQIDDLTRLAE